MNDIYHTVRNFLFSNLNKQFMVFLFFFVLSGIFWLILTLNESYERELKVPVHLSGIPKNVVLTSAEVDTVRVTLRDKGWMLLSYLYGKRAPSLTLPFKSYDRGNGGGIISSSDIKRIVKAQTELSTTVVSVKPDRLEFFYNNGERKRVPVRWAGRVIPEQLYFISSVSCKPDSVDVYSSREKLDSIQMVYSEPLNYVGFRDTLTVSCAVATQSDMKVVPNRVTFEFCTDVLTEASLDGVPITCINLPEGKMLRTFPAKVKVHFVTGVSQLRQLLPEDFTVIADYREIMQSASDKCNLYLRTVPEGVSRATLANKQVDYLIEEE